MSASTGSELIWLLRLAFSLVSACNGRTHESYRWKQYNNQIPQCLTFFQMHFRSAAALLISYILTMATCRGVLRRSKFAIWLAGTAAFALVIASVTPVGTWLTLSLENRFPQWQPNAQAAPTGIIVLGGEAGERIAVLAELSQRFPKARLVYSGPGERIFAAEKLLETFARLGGDPARITMETRSRSTFENAIYSRELIKPDPNERWQLVTSAMHMPRAVVSFRHVGFKVEAYPVEVNAGDGSHVPVTLNAGSKPLSTLARTLREWTALIAYRLMGRTDAYFPAP
jgi:uncharacterized SAM-binding protein YcdF (DUF218 family)